MTTEPGGVLDACVLLDLAHSVVRCFEVGTAWRGRGLQEEAESIKAQLEEASATVELK